MTEDAHDRLAAIADHHRIVRRLHDVPPHEVYEVHLDGRRAVYKGTSGPTGRAGTEGHVTAFVGEHTSVPVPPVVHVGRDFYVAGWHQDAPEPGDDHPATDAWIEAAGRGLATLHGESAAAVTGFGRPRPAEDGLVAPHDDWHEAALAWLRDRRTAVARHGQTDVVDAVLSAIEDRRWAFEGAGEPVCCHGWWTPEHVAVADGAVACVVDFEHAMAAPAEFDYWRTVLPSVPDGAGRDRFRRAYRSRRSLPDGIKRRAPYYRLLCAVSYLESLYVQDQHGPSATARRATALRSRIRDHLADIS